MADRPAESRFVMFGAGYFARQFFERYPDADCAGFVVDPEYRTSPEYLGLPVYTEIAGFPVRRYLLGTGDFSHRIGIVTRAREAGLQPTAPFTDVARLVDRSARIGEGCILGFGVTVEYDAEVGAHCLLMDRALVAHGVRIGSNVILSPNVFVGRSAEIGSNTFIGANASIAPSVVIGENCHIAMGAACFKDVPADCTAIGSPARIVRTEP